MRALPWLLVATLAAGQALGQATPPSALAPAPRAARTTAPAPHTAPVPGTPAPGAPAPSDHPTLVPAREASVLYRVASTGRPLIEVRVTTQPGGGTMRIDMPDLTYMLVNQAGRHMALVSPNDSMVMEVPFDGGLQEAFLLTDRMRFNRRGPETVAGNRCTLWEVALDANRGIVCVTDDGVLLRSVTQDPQGRRSVIDAISVSYTPAPASDFQEPAGYEHMVTPSQ